MLAVSAPFHCALLTPAGEQLAVALAAVPVRRPRWPVLHNVDASEAGEPEAIRARLVAQVSEPVLWEACVLGLVARGAQRALEVGPGRTLAGLIKRIHRPLSTISLDTPGAFSHVSSS